MFIEFAENLINLNNVSYITYEAVEYHGSVIYTVKVIFSHETSITESFSTQDAMLCEYEALSNLLLKNAN